MAISVYKSSKAKNRILETYDQLISMWDVVVEERRVETRYGSTQVIICGDEDLPPLVLFHGVGDDSALMWLFNAKELSKHFRLYAVDTIGGPGKSVPNDAYNKRFDDLIWIDELLDLLALDQVSMAGVSNGGYLIQYYGANRPERVGKMVSMACAVPADRPGNTMISMIKIFLPEALFPTDRNIARLIRKLSGDNSHVITENPVVMAHYASLLRGFNTMAMTYHKIRSLDDSQIDSIRDRVLYLIGNRDPFALMGGKALLVEYKMNARFFDGVGHGINHEMADETNAMIIRFLQQ